MMKKVYLVHCWDGNCEDGWYPWVSNELEKLGVKVIRFDMPNTENPMIAEWVRTLDEKVENLDEETYFVGHSIGCQTIMRFLEKKNDKIGGILFVTPWFDLLPYAVEDEGSYKTAEPWINTPINFEKIKEVTNNIRCIFSSDDYFVSENQEKQFKDKLNAKTLMVENKGHISEEDGVFELEEILIEAKKVLKL